MKRAATATSIVQDAQFYARPTRHGIIKCYREFVVGRPRLPPLLSLVVVVKPGSILGLRAAGEAGSTTLLPTDAKRTLQKVV